MRSIIFILGLIGLIKAVSAQELKAVPMGDLTEGGINVEWGTPSGEIIKQFIKVPSLKKGMLILNYKKTEYNEAMLLIDPQTITVSDDVIYFNSVERVYRNKEEIKLAVEARVAFDCKSYKPKYLSSAMFNYALEISQTVEKIEIDAKTSSLFDQDVAKRLCSMRGDYGILWPAHFNFLREISPQILTLEEKIVPHYDLQQQKVKKLTDSVLTVFLKIWNGQFENIGINNTSNSITAADNEDEKPTYESKDIQSNNLIDSVQVAVENAKLRKEASSSSTVLASLSEGENLPVVIPPKLSDEWIQVVYVGKQVEGFVKRSDIVVNESLPPKTSQFNEIATGNNLPPRIILYNKSRKTVRITLGSDVHSIAPQSHLEITSAPGTVRFFAWAPGVIPTSGMSDFKTGYEYNWEFWIETTVRRGRGRKSK